MPFYVVVIGAILCMLLVDKELLYKLILFLYFRLTNWIADGTVLYLSTIWQVHFV